MTILTETIETPFDLPSPGSASVATTVTGDELEQFDRYGRRLLPDPDVMKGDVPWTRVTTFAKSIEDFFSLAAWQRRQVALGMGRRPDLFFLASTIADNATKANAAALGDIVDECDAAAGTSAAATRGTAMHTVVERHEAGVKQAVPPPYDRDLAAYQRLVDERGLGPVTLAEKIVVCKRDGIQVAGRFDQVRLRHAGTEERPAIFDLKTGGSVGTFGQLSMLVQLAVYAYATHIWDPESKTYIPMPPVDQDNAYVIAVPVGTAQAKLYRLDIAEAWQTLVPLCREVRKCRSAAKRWMVEDTGPSLIVPVPAQTQATGTTEVLVPQIPVPAAKGGRRCGKCGQTGHNARTCTGAAPVTPEPAPATAPVTPELAPAEAGEWCECAAPAGWTKTSDDPEVWSCARCGKPSKATTERMRAVHADDEAFREKHSGASSTPVDNAVDSTDTRGDQPWQPAAEEAAHGTIDVNLGVPRVDRVAKYRVLLRKASSKPEIRRIRDAATEDGTWCADLEQEGLKRLQELLSGPPAPASAPEPAPAEDGGPWAPQAPAATDWAARIRSAGSSDEIKKIRRDALAVGEWTTRLITIGQARVDELEEEKAGV